MHECYAMQILEAKKTKETKNKSNGHKSRAKKHKDHVKKTHLDLALCIQNFLDAPRALEFLFTVY